MLRTGTSGRTTWSTSGPRPPWCWCCACSTNWGSSSTSRLHAASTRVSSPTRAASGGPTAAPTPSGLGLDELESVIDIVRTTAEAEVAAVLKELAPQEWSVSLRAKRHLDVSAAAQAFGGGGHRLAAGFSASGAPEDVLAALRDALAR